MQSSIILLNFEGVSDYIIRRR